MIENMVSVIVPVYNASESLKKCVESIVAQTYENIEIILVNDGSTDNSLDICKELAAKDKRIIVCDKENGGLTSARKYGFDISNGKYLCFVDSDDYVDKDYIKKHIENIQNTNAQMSICSYCYVNKNDIKKITLKYKSKIFDRKYFTTELILPRIFSCPNDNTVIPDFVWLRMYDRNLITKEAFVSERKVYTEDIFFNFEYLKYCNKVSIIDDCLYYYVNNEKSLTNKYRNNKVNMESARVELQKKYLYDYNCYDDLRIMHSLFKSLQGCYINASSLSSFNEFKKEMKLCLQTPEIEKMIKSKNMPYLSKKEQIVRLLCRFKLFGILYFIKKL